MVCRVWWFPTNIVSSNSSANFKVSIIGDLNVATDYESINYWSFKFPRNLNFENYEQMDFEVINTSDSKSRIDIQNSNLNLPPLQVEHYIQILINCQCYPISNS